MVNCIPAYYGQCARLSFSDRYAALFPAPISFVWLCTQPAQEATRFNPAMLSLEFSAPMPKASMPSEIVRFRIGVGIVNLDFRSGQHRQLESVPEFG